MFGERRADLTTVLALRFSTIPQANFDIGDWHVARL
jgi:hypothetical protein